MYKIRQNFKLKDDIKSFDQKIDNKTNFLHLY